MLKKTVLVSSLSGLRSALAAAKGGEIIELTQGSYGNLDLGRYQFDDPVTIKGGTFSSVALRAVKGIHLDGAQVNVPASAMVDSNSQAVRIWGSSDVAFINSRVVGGLATNGVSQSSRVLDGTGNVIGLPAGVGVYVGFSSNITVANSDISLFHKGVLMYGGDNITIANNKIHDLRTTPISGTVPNNLTITGNHTWNSTPWNYGADGDHGDRIHIWTNKTPTSGLVITNNVLEQGTGAPMLGILIDDLSNNLGFNDVVITGNRLVDGHHLGITLANVSGGVLTNNTLTWSGSGTLANNAPQIYVKDNSNALYISGNIAPLWLGDGTSDVQVINHTGITKEATTLTAEQRDSISFDFKVVTTSSTAKLSEGVSDLTFVGSGDFSGTGNRLANRITGGSGNDVLVGDGGADILNGGLGNDSYYIDNTAQTIIDSGGVDTIY